MKYGYVIAKLFQDASNHPEEAGFFIGWLIAAAIESAIIAVIVAAIAKLANEKNVFGEWFVGAFAVVGVIEFLLYLIS